MKYTYLFKGLEDLHLDERIMPFLSTDNQMMSEYNIYFKIVRNLRIPKRVPCQLNSEYHRCVSSGRVEGLIMQREIEHGILDSGWRTSMICWLICFESS